MAQDIFIIVKIAICFLLLDMTAIWYYGLTGRTSQKNYSFVGPVVTYAIGYLQQKLSTLAFI